MKKYTLHISVIALVCFYSTKLGAQTTNSIGQTTTQSIITEKIDSLLKPANIFTNEDKKVYETIKPNTLITTKEYELILDENKKKNAQINKPQ